MSRDIPMGHKTSGWQSQGLSSLSTTPMPWLAHSGAKGEFSSPAGAPGPFFTRGLGVWGERARRESTFQIHTMQGGPGVDEEGWGPSRLWSDSPPGLSQTTQAGPGAMARGWFIDIFTSPAPTPRWLWPPPSQNLKAPK